MTVDRLSCSGNDVWKLPYRPGSDETGGGISYHEEVVVCLYFRAAQETMIEHTTYVFRLLKTRETRESQIRQGSGHPSKYLTSILPERPRFLFRVGHPGNALGVSKSNAFVTYYRPVLTRKYIATYYLAIE